MLPRTALLFGFWLVLSGKFDSLHLALGLACAYAAARFQRGLAQEDPPLAPGLGLALLVRLPGYALWLLKEVVVSAFQVARIVLDPKLPIDPRLIRFERRLPHPAAALLLGNSITLTPGTVTLDVAGDDYVVHALVPSPGMEDGGGEMGRRAADLFAGGGSR